MNTVSQTVQAFFEAYKKGSNTLDLGVIDPQYEDTFIFADPNGTQVVEKQKFLGALPQRQGFFKILGHQSTKLLSLEETRLDERYVMVKAYFLMQFKKASGEFVEAEFDSTYILHIKNDVAKIVFQIEHHDLHKAMKERGLLPAS